MRLSSSPAVAHVMIQDQMLVADLLGRLAQRFDSGHTWTDDELRDIGLTDDLLTQLDAIERRADAALAVA